MSRRDLTSIYDKNHLVQVWNRHGFMESRTINFNITDLHDYIQIKVRDGGDFVFNYTANIDLRHFELMRNEQSLDIDFQEFKSNLLDMLQQVHKQEMYLKCEIDGSKCKIIFYTKSKIKSIVFLTIDLQLTNQKEIFDEMNNSISDLQSQNRNLTSQLQTSKQQLTEKNAQIELAVAQKQQLEKRFVVELRRLDALFEEQLHACSRLLLGRLLALAQRLPALARAVAAAQASARAAAEARAAQQQRVEQLRREAQERARLADDVQRENCQLRGAQLAAEQRVGEQRAAAERAEAARACLERQRDELERDVKQAALIIAQKAKANEELARDVVQANQMLVNFNHLFDTKNGEIEALRGGGAAMERAVGEQKQRLFELRREFDEYRAKFSAESYNALASELFSAKKRVEEVEKLNRETVKLNELLTRKVASGNFPRAALR